MAKYDSVNEPNPGESADIFPLLKDASSLGRESRRRKKDHDFTSVSPARVDELLSEGWQIEKRLRKRVRLKRPKPHDERLENRLWLLLYKLGYKHLNQGRPVKILLKGKGTRDSYAHPAVFAGDDETILVAYCHSAETLTRKSLQRDLTEFAAQKGAIAGAVRRLYGRDFRPKILWMFVTNNVIWSKPDIERAAQNRIHRITERELRYYNQIADHLGHAARYQFLAEFLANQRIPALADRKTSAIRGRLGGHTFYSFLITPDHLLKISFVNHRSLNDPAGLPSYQRLVSRGRLRSIRKFLESGGYFPTNLLINFTERPRFDQTVSDPHSGLSFGQLYLPDKYKSAWIIDGQHRLYGYSNLPDAYLNQPLIVIAFQGLSPGEEAELFVTINHEQKSVPRNLLDELEGDLRWGSEVPAHRVGALAARTIQLLNDDVGEPFFNRVTAQGIPATQHTCLTVPQIKEGLKRSGLLGKVTNKRGTYSPGPLTDSTDLRTLERTRDTLNIYFRQIQEANFELWDAGREGYICTNVGIQGHLLLLASILIALEEDNHDLQRMQPEELILAVKPFVQPILDFLATATREEAARAFQVPYGAGGRRQYLFRLTRLARRAVPGFSPPGFAAWEEAQSHERVKRAEEQIREINILVQHKIFEVLRSRYGNDETGYWEKGISDVQMRVRAYQKQQENPVERRLSLENYLDFLDYMKIVKAPSHWQVFEPYFNIPEDGSKGTAKNLQWMEKINLLRRIVAHPTTQRQFKLDDFDYLDWLEVELRRRLTSE